MRTLHIVGRKNHGKTTLVLDLIRELTGRGLRVGSIKHTSHLHDLDTPGSDSYRHRRAGAAPAAIVTGDTIGVFFPRGATGGFYDALAPLYAGCDLVLVEGDLERPAPKIEVYRAELGTPCLAADRPDILAVVTDDPVDLPVAVWPRSGLAALADRVLAMACSGRSPSEEST
jgi:molybdopterin-guanine dinucleotide biosynthesis protein B